MARTVTESGTWSLIAEPSSTELSWNGPHLQMRATMDTVFRDEHLNGGEWRYLSGGTDRCAAGSEEFDSCATDKFEKHGIVMIRHICYSSLHPESFQLKLTVLNGSHAQVALDRFVLLRAAGAEALRLGDSDAGSWSFFRSGRHKNDLPAVCVLGKDDEAFQDTVAGLSETGRKLETDGKVPCHVVSDELSVIKAHEGEGPGSLLIGFVGKGLQLVECQIATDPSRSDFARLEAACLLDGVMLQPGESRESEWLRLDGREDSFAAIDAFVRVKSELGSSRAAAEPPSVYCTWYYYGDTVKEEDVLNNLEVLAKECIPIDVVQIDAAWERRYGDWEANHRFPRGMKYVADRIKDRGYRPGIWTAPFIVEPRCDLIYYKPDWLLRNSKGEPVRFEMNSAQNLVLDVSHPEVQQWIEDLYRKLTEWGYTYHKLDFTRAVVMDADAVYFDKGLTRAEVYRKGIEAVRRGAGSDGYVLICGGLFSAPSGLVDAHRTSSDVLSMWNAAKGGWRARMVAPFTVKQNVLRYWMNRLWHNDPDALMIRRNTKEFRSLENSLGLFTDEEAKVITLNQYFGGGLICFTEPMAELDEDRKGLLRHIVPSTGEASVPRDLFKGSRYASVYDTAVRPSARAMGDWNTVSVVNWTDEPAAVSLRLDERLVGKPAADDGTFVVAEFWSGRIVTEIAAENVIDTGEIPAHSAVHYRIAPRHADEPQLIYSNGHFSMGGTEITDWRYDEAAGALKLHVRWRWNFPLKLIIAAPDGRKWQPADDFGSVSSAEPQRFELRLPGYFEGEIELKLGDRNR